MLNISKETRFLIRKALREDIGTRDITTEALIPRNAIAKACIEAKQDGILCGGPVVSEVFRQIDSKLKVVQKVRDGAQVRKGQGVFTIRGRIRPILKAERTALNFLGRLSGVATLTHEFVALTRGTKAQVLDTRKTTPLWRELEKYAIRCGGGKNHRFGLWDEILVKDNHWVAIRPLLEKTACRYFAARLKSIRLRKIPLEVEVGNLRQLTHLLDGDFLPDRILLDNFPVRALKKAVQMVRKRRAKLLLEASGGINLLNVRRIAKTGVDRISIGALTHSVSALDFSLEIERVFSK